MSNNYSSVYKLVLGGVLFGWFIKLPVFFWTYLNKTTFEFPVYFEQFPSFFESPLVSCIFYFLPLVTVASLFIKVEDKVPLFHRISAALLLLSSLILMLHSATYNDATFVTGFWVSLWLLWYSFHPEEEHGKHACALAAAIVSLTFFGGFIGKCSSGWWNGEVLFGIMQSFFTHWPFEWLKNNLTFEQQKLIAKLLSWGIIFIELAVASSFFWPRRFTLKYIPFVIFAIDLFATTMINNCFSFLPKKKSTFCHSFHSIGIDVSTLPNKR